MNFIEQATTLLNGGPTIQRQFFLEPQTEFLNDMIQHLGDADPQVRDELNYRLLIDLVQYHILSDEQKQQLIDEIVSQNLLLGTVGSTHGTTVFQRALSTEWLRLLLTEDQMKSELGKKILEDALLLMERERDLRAYTEEGFAYSVGNAALLIYVLLQERQEYTTYAAPVLMAIQSNFWKEHVFTDDEEERFLSLIELLLANGIEEDLLVEWIEQIFDRLEMISQYEGFSAHFLKGRTAVLQFMRAFYFTLKFKNNYKKLQSTISIFIQKWYKI